MLINPVRLMLKQNVLLFHRIVELTCKKKTLNVAAVRILGRAAGKQTHWAD